MIKSIKSTAIFKLLY